MDHNEMSGAFACYCGPAVEGRRASFRLRRRRRYVAAQSIEPRTEEWMPTRPTILVVVDDAELRGRLAEHLRRRYEPDYAIAAAPGVEAVTMLTSGQLAPLRTSTAACQVLV
jgi:hypothetical protein